MAGHRPAVIVVEMAERVVEHAPRRRRSSRIDRTRVLRLRRLFPGREYGKGLRQMASQARSNGRPHERVAHDHRHRRLVRHRRLLRPGAEGAKAGACSRRRASRRTSPRSRPTASKPSISTIASRTRSRRWSTTVLERTGGTLDALFNNGAYSQPGAVEDLPVAALREQFEANFFGWHDLTRRIVPVMRRAGPRPHRPLLVDPRPGAGQMARRLCRVEARARRADAVHARRNSQGSGIHVSLIEPGPVESKIATNALAWFLKNIDHENSVHRDAYQAQLARLRGGGSAVAAEAGPDAVYAVLRHALLSPRPRPHYVVTCAGKDRRAAEAHPAGGAVLPHARRAAPELATDRNKPWQPSSTSSPSSSWSPW